MLPLADLKGAQEREMMPRASIQHLRFKGIKPRTAKLYKREITRFFAYLTSEGLSIPSTEVCMDETVAEFINVLFQEGDSISHAGWLLSGLKRFMPQLKHKLPTAQQFFNNWQRDHCPKRAVPMPWNVLRTMAGIAWEGGHFDLALLLLLGFSFYLRSMEMISLTNDAVQMDTARGVTFLTLFQTKTSRQFQQSLVFRNKALAHIVSLAKAKLPSGLLWNYGARSFRLAFNALLDYLALTPFHFSLYSLRRGGATFAYLRSHNLDKVAIQGRWKDHRTAKIYLDDARAELLRQELPSSFWPHSQRVAVVWQNVG